MTPVYEIQYTPAAVKSLKAIGRADRRLVQNIAQKIKELTHDPRPRVRSKVLRGPEGYRRLRVGSYREIYAVDDAAGTVLVLEAGHRKTIYRDPG